MSDPAGFAPGRTAICRIGGGMVYRGYRVGELAERVPFDAVAFMLLTGELPTADDLADFRLHCATIRWLPDAIRRLFENLPPRTPPIEALRTAVSLLGHSAPGAAGKPTELTSQAVMLIAQVPVVVADYYRASRGLRTVPARRDLSGSANFLYMMRGRDATPAEIRALEQAMIVTADHEFCPSTYAARVIMAAGGDLHAAVAGAVGALKGPHAGGAGAGVIADLEAAANSATVEAWTLDALHAGRLAGFGPGIDATGDVRGGLLQAVAGRAAADAGPAFVRLERVAAEVERVVAREVGWRPTVEWPAARVYHALGLDGSLFTPLFAMARMVGWCAHAIEQRGQNVVIRPRAEYVGPDDRVVPESAEPD